MATNQVIAIRRAAALDALRGLAILGMVFAGVIPFGGKNALPRWMYHAQEPPPTHQFNPDLPGITWVDLVFPLFLFSLGAAIPLALSRRLERGARMRDVIGGVLARGGLLAVFALARQHLDPWFVIGYSRYKGTLWPWIIGLTAFAVLFPVLVRLPATIPRAKRIAVRVLGWTALIGLMATVGWPQVRSDATRSHLSAFLARNDIIIMVLANVVVTGSLAWLVTRRILPVRLLIMVIGIAVHLACNAPPNWVRDLTELKTFEVALGPHLISYVTWAFQPAYSKYLLIVIPGTIAGDLLLAWMHGERREVGVERRAAELRGGVAAELVLLAVAIVVLTLCGLLARWGGWMTGAVALLVGSGYALLEGGRHRADQSANSADLTTGDLLRRLWVWGAGWLAIGLILEPYQGGIKKDHATLSYFFVTASLAHMALVALTVITDVWRGRRYVTLLSANGENPMIAYLAATFLVQALLHLIKWPGGASLADMLDRALPGGWPGAFRGALITFLAALAVAGFTKKRIYWRT